MYCVCVWGGGGGGVGGWVNVFWVFQIIFGLGKKLLIKMMETKCDS